MALMFRPWESKVDYHQREYEAAVHSLFGTRLVDRAWSALQRAGVPVEKLWRQDADALLKITKHQEALVKSGYFVERGFAVSNRSAWRVQETIAMNWHQRLGNDHRRFSLITASIETNVLKIIDRPEEMSFWEATIRRADVP